MIGTKVFYAISTTVLLLVCELVFAAEHSAEFSSRLRYSDLNDASESGKGASGLFRLSLNSSWTENFSTFLQFDHVETGYDNQHSDGVRFNGQPVLTDVPSTEVNEAFVSLSMAGWDFSLGRQSLAFDNQRFVGSVSFWQNDQTLDAFLLEKNLLSASKFTYAYVANANRIFGDDADENLQESDLNFVALNGNRPLAALGDHEHNSHLIRGEFNEWDYSKLVTYAYLIDNKDAPATSSDSVGVHYRFKIKPNKFQYRFELEGAIQKRTEISEKPTMSYFMADSGVGFGSSSGALELSARWEKMGAKDGVAFFTPLGTLHDFHGWADQFNIPPGIGLNDQSFQLKWRVAPFQFDVRYHRFSADESSEKFGSEVDFDIIYKPLKKHMVMLRFADFRSTDSSDRFQDKRRVFFQYSYNL